MSTGKFNEVATQGNTADISIARSGSTAKDKFTAADIEKDCPACLQRIGEEITKRFLQAQEQEKILDDQVIELKKLFAEVNDLCDSGGFDAFRARFFPNLCKSCVYELLAIWDDRKSIKEVRASTRARVAKHRAIKAKTPDSVTVTEKSKPLEAPTEAGLVEPPCIAAEQTAETAKPRSAAAPADDAHHAFTVRVMELDRSTAKRPPQHFAATVVPVAVLARLAALLTDIANLKKSDADGAH